MYDKLLYIIALYSVQLDPVLWHFQNDCMAELWKKYGKNYQELGYLMVSCCSSVHWSICLQCLHAFRMRSACIEKPVTNESPSSDQVSTNHMAQNVWHTNTNQPTHCPLVEVPQPFGLSDFYRNIIYSPNRPYTYTLTNTIKKISPTC